MLFRSVKFFKDAPAEVRFTAWKALGKNLQNLVPTHPLLKEFLVESTVKDSKPAPAPAPAPAKPAATPKPRTRK